MIYCDFLNGYDVVFVVFLICLFFHFIFSMFQLNVRDSDGFVPYISIYVDGLN